MVVLSPFTTSEKSILERSDASLFEDAAKKSSFHTASAGSGHAGCAATNSCTLHRLKRPTRFVLQKGTLEALEIKLDARYQRLSRMLLAVSPALACELTSDVER
jgi:hypothetical protein